MFPKLVIFLVLTDSAGATACTSAETCPDSQVLLQARLAVDKLADQQASEEESQIGTGEMTRRFEALTALGHSVGAVHTSMDSSQELSVMFRHDGQEYNYKLAPRSVYTENASIYEDGKDVTQLGAESSLQPSTFNARADGNWASLTLLGDKMVGGVFEQDGKVIEISPVSHHAELAEALLQHSSYEDNDVHPAHLIRWVSSLELGTAAKWGPGGFPGLDDVGDGTDIPKDTIDFGPDPVSDWNGVKWWPGCYTGDSDTHELILSIAADKAAHEKAAFHHSGSLKQMIEYAVHEASWVFERQMNIRLKIGHLAMDTTGAEYGECPAKDEVHDRLAKIKSAVESGKVPAGAASHIFTGCGKDSGLLGLAYKGTICEKKWAVGATKIHAFSSAWLVFAHELGHNFNAKHSFEAGKGETGGLMDYGDGKLNGEYQFNSLRKSKMCAKLESKVNKCDGKFQIDTSPPPTRTTMPPPPHPSKIVPETPPPTVTPLPPLPTSGELPDCKGDRNSWNAGGGMCDSYTQQVGNHPWCWTDKQTVDLSKDKRHSPSRGGVPQNNGLKAWEACSECGRCKDPVHTGPHICAWRHGKWCRCNGHVYIGKKYVSGTSGALTTFEQLKQGKEGPDWARLPINPGMAVTRTFAEGGGVSGTMLRCSTSNCPLTATFVPAVLPGVQKYCWCDPSGPPATTNAPTQAPTQAPTEAPPGFGDGGGGLGGNPWR